MSTRAKGQYLIHASLVWYLLSASIRSLNDGEWKIKVETLLVVIGRKCSNAPYSKSIDTRHDERTEVIPSSLSLCLINKL